MKNDARSLSTEEKHLLRKIAVQRVLDGEVAAEVARSYGLGDRTIYHWLKIAREQGFDALSPKARTGRNRKLTDIEAEEVKRWIVGDDPRQFGFGLWTRQIVAELIESRFGIHLSLPSVGTLLRRLGLTPQRPVRRAYERDDKAIQTWKDDDYPEIKKEAKRRNAEIFWLDEAAIRSDDPLLRTWGLKGQTPEVKTSGQRQKVNAISAISNSGGFWYRLYTGSFNADVFIECLKDLIKN
jgi:transposase